MGAGCIVERIERTATHDSERPKKCHVENFANEVHWGMIHNVRLLFDVPELELQPKRLQMLHQSDMAKLMVKASDGATSISCLEPEDQVNRRLP